MPNILHPPALADRFRGALWGQFVGDAVCLGSHWIYDLEEMARRYPGGIQGFESPFPGHYHAGKKPGDQTHYGDAALLILESVAAIGRFDPLEFGARFVTLMGSSSYTGYRDHATRETLARVESYQQAHPSAPFDFQEGATDDQMATATRLAPVVVAHHRNANLLDVVTAATRVTQNHPRAIAYMRCHARILLALFDGHTLDDACAAAAAQCEREGEYGAEVSSKVRLALAARSLPTVEATLQFGQSCPLASSFPGALQAALAHEHQIADAILATARAGGDNAGRAALVGAWLGATHGMAGIPADWRERLTAREAIGRAVEGIVARAVSPS